MKYKQFIISLMAVILGLIAGAILMGIMGHNPIEGYNFLFKGGLMNIERIGNTLATATPLILTGLSLAFAFKTGLFNIGAPGQLLMGGFFATAVGLSVDLKAPILIPLVVISGLIGGAIWALIPGLLKAKFNVHEVVSTIMMNWVAYWIVYYMIPMHFKGEFLETESAQLPANATLRIKALTDLFEGSFINMGIIIAIISVWAVWFILNKTVLGYELKAVGFNRDAALYAGISVNRNIILSMMIAGALSGLAGVVQYSGNSISMQIGVMPSQGFDGIAVALLGASNPIGVLLSALFFGILYTGKGFMNAMTSIPPEIADTIMATIIYFAATSVIMERIFNKFKKKREKNLNKNANQETTKERVVSK
ncbi:ABC transporter permease [Clostridium sp.]|uniref:ABC transporter permease n=1 Tax=Clostridium sp. TaxID=1506 RepID=UPI00260D99F8|nr:ABC transporter permease [Clostridium sp.]